jgi:tetratricopeptide (TPR) repeat protein
MAGKVKDDRSPASHVAVAVPSEQTRPEPDAGPEDPGVHRLYSAALIAAVLGVPPAAVRHWTRGGLLEPVRRAGSLEWFDFPQLVVGRHLARLLAGGLSLREIDAKLADLAPGGGPAAAKVAERIVADGRRLSIRADGLLLGPGGQMQFTFYTDRLDRDAPRREALPAIVPGWPPDEPAAAVPAPADAEAAEILDLADDLEAAGEFAEAAEAVRAVLQAQGPTAPVMFTLAELLYRSGDLTAARERYYATIEIDPEHLRARTSLGCVLAELGEHELALAALEGVLRQEPDYADAHWHTAGVLAEVGRSAEARHHLRTFLELAPDSPWAASARERLHCP